LHNLKKEIASAKALLNSYNILCERKREEAANLNNEISRLEAIISRFKNNKEKYLKIQQTVENKVGSVLTDGKVLL
jgi:division protein CdvB (Snf7/Vps24/ESCRT-III family)